MGTIVREGVSGRLFPLAAPADHYAAYIADVMGDRDQYQALAASGRRLYEEEINWARAGRRFLETLTAATSQ
jgi:glycosyltransferase involved in cell wall biosynthesis